MYSDVLYSFTIGFVGAILFLLVDKYESEGPLARLPKFLILFVAGVAILHNCSLRVWLALQCLLIAFCPYSVFIDL